MATFISPSINTKSDRLFSVLPTHSYHLYDQASERRGDAELAVKAIFRQVYNADINEFSPLLIAAEAQDQIDTVIGLRNASQATLFLESYLPAPIEQLIAQQHELVIERHRFIELGNLVAVRSGSSRQLFIVLAFVLAAAGVEWVAFTATQQVKQLLVKLGLSPIMLAPAHQAALASGDANWGSYYLDSPTVCFGNVKTAIAVLSQSPTVNAIYPAIEATIKRLAQQISRGFDL